MIYYNLHYYPLSLSKKELTMQDTFVYSCRLLLSNPKRYSCQEFAKSSLTQCKPGRPLSSTSRLALICCFVHYSGMSLQTLAMVEWQQKWPCGTGYVSPCLSPQSGHSLSKPYRNVFHILRLYVCLCVMNGLALKTENIHFKIAGQDGVVTVT